MRLAEGRRGLADDFLVEHRLALIEHAPDDRTDPRPQGRNQLGRPSTDVRFDGQPINRGKCLVDPYVTQLAIQVREPDRCLGEQRIEDRRGPFLLIDVDRYPYPFNDGSVGIADRTGLDAHPPVLAVGSTDAALVAQMLAGGPGLLEPDRDARHVVGMDHGPTVGPVRLSRQARELRARPVDPGEHPVSAHRPHGDRQRLSDASEAD